MFMLISYDIPDNKRRLKVANTLLDFGGERVQYSVFECHITPRNLEKLQARLRKVLVADEDSIRLYPLCDTCRPKVVLLGSAKATEEPGLRIL
jgi:CRISPR-associated protein Cas2